MKSEFRDDIIDYDCYKSRLDIFMNSIMGGKANFSKLYYHFKMLFTHSHGQASVERGFSINKDVIDTNMNKKTVVARRIILGGVSNLLPAEHHAGCLQDLPNLRKP